MDLFNPHKTDKSVNDEAIQQVPGLRLLYNFITPSEEKELIGFIDNGEWLNDLKRKVQHYGYKYDYKARYINESFRVKPLPEWATNLSSRFQNQEITHFMSDQLIINNYEPGQGIASHIDCEPCFADTILSLSLGSDIVMDFTEVSSNIKYSFLLPRRSLIILTGQSRYDFQHGIAARKTDEFNGMKKPRKRRISLTFRKIILGP